MRSLVLQCKLLNEVDLTDCYSTDDRALYELLQCPTLTILTLAECYKVTWKFENVENFNKQVAKNSTVKSLCMRHTLIDDNSVLTITELCDSLRILDLR